MLPIQTFIEKPVHTITKSHFRYIYKININNLNYLKKNCISIMVDNIQYYIIYFICIILIYIIIHFSHYS